MHCESQARRAEKKGLDITREEREREEEEEQEQTLISDDQTCLLSSRVSFSLRGIKGREREKKEKVWTGVPSWLVAPCI